MARQLPPAYDQAQYSNPGIIQLANARPQAQPTTYAPYWYEAIAHLAQAVGQGKGRGKCG